MTPIEKNVIVVDELGNEYEATYPKRAKGLVKNGRARFIDDNKICLACPPDTELEDNIMSENKNVSTNIPEETAEVIATEQSAFSVVPTPISISYVLEKMEEIANDQAYILASIEAISQIKSTGPGDVGTQEQTKAIGDIVKARETTNQRLIAFYEKLYDDLKPKTTSVVPSERMQVIHALINTLGDGMTPIESKEALENILGVALQDLTRNI